MPMLARLERQLTIQQQTVNLDARQGIADTFTTVGTLLGIMGSTKPGQTIERGQITYTVDHAITARGPAYSGAKPGDRLLLGGVAYLIHGIEDAGLQQEFTVYMVSEERSQPV